MRSALALAAAIAWAAAAHAAEPVWVAHLPSVKTAHPPMIVLLHGAGSDERDMVGLWRQLPQDFIVVSPRAPFGDAGRGYRWYESKTAAGFAKARAVIDHVVDGATKEYGADPARVFIGGFSQGAVMTFDVALREPGKFRGAAVLSGALLAVTPRTASPTPVFIGHGTTDDRIPYAAAESAKAELARLGVPVTFHAYAGMGHDVGAAETRDLSDWLRQRAN